MLCKKLGVSATLLLIVSLLISGCGTNTAEPTAVPTGAAPTQQSVATSAPTSAPATKTSAPIALTATPKPVPQVLRLFEGTALVLDPGRSGAGDGLHIMYNLYRGLVWLDAKTGKAEPACAKSWEMSADGTVWTFHLRDDLKWSDGKRLTANDFKYAWVRNLSPDVYVQAWLLIKGSTAYSSGENTDPESLGIEVVDDLTLKVTCEEPCSFFPLSTADLAMMPLRQDIIEKYGDKWIEPEHLIVNGPFAIQSWTPDKEVVLVRNPKYWGEPAKLDKVVFSLVESAATSCMLSYPAGEVDVCEVALNELPRLSSDPVLSKEIKLLNELRTEWLEFDTSHAPWDDIRVRQAFAMAIDKEAISKAASKGAYPAALTLLPPVMEAYSADAALKGDIKTAQSLLAAAGYPKGAGFPEVKMVFVSGAGTPMQLAVEAIQSMWSTNLGVKVVLEPIERSAFYDWFRGKSEVDWDIDVMNYGSDLEEPSSFLNQLFTCDADVFSTHWCNKQYDELVTKAYGEVNPKERVRLYREAEKLLIQEAAIIPLWHRSMLFLVKPNVKDMQFSRALNWDLVHEAYISE